MLLDCNLLEINISYGFGNIKAINLLCQQPAVQLVVTLMLENVEHCGGEPEQADTGTALYH